MQKLFLKSMTPEQLENVQVLDWIEGFGDVLSIAQANFIQRFGKLLVSLTNEQEEYKILLKDIAQRQMTLDILRHISKLDDEQIIDSRFISSELGYPEEKVQEVLELISKKKVDTQDSSKGWVLTELDKKLNSIVNEYDGLILQAEDIIKVRILEKERNLKLLRVCLVERFTKVRKKDG